MYIEVVKSKIKISADLVSGEGTLSSLPMAMFVLCSYIADSYISVYC